MSEKDKRDLGLLYDANYDKELEAERIKCKLLCQKYNSLPYDAFDERADVMRRIIGKTGERFFVEQSFWADYGYNIEFGENFYSNHNLVILDGAKVTFGDNVFIAPNCAFYTAGHPLDVEQRNAGLEYAYSIKVGDNVWFGGNVVVLPGTEIGDNTVIGAGSVVSGKIPSGVIAAGNRCKPIREITETDKERYRKK